MQQPNTLPQVAAIYNRGFPAAGLGFEAHREFAESPVTMPIYAYKCAACGHAKDVLQKMSDALLTVCPACGASEFVKQVTAAGFQLKGSGWYVTDFRDGGGKKGEDGKAAAAGPADSAQDSTGANATSGAGATPAAGATPTTTGPASAAPPVSSSTPATPSAALSASAAASQRVAAP